MSRDPTHPKDGLPAPWAPFSQRPVPVRLQSLLERARAALPDAAHEDQQRERLVERKVVGLTLEGELRAVAARLGGGLALFQEAVAVCASALRGAGELARAASLLLDAGLHADAADAAVAAGDVDVLTRSLDAVHGPEARSLEAQRAFHLYESALASQRPGDALEALSQAAASRPDNPAYADLQRQLLARRPSPGVLVLHAGHEVRLFARAPATLGRGEDATVRIPMPGVSRRHATVDMVDGAVRLADAQGQPVWTEVLSPLRVGAPRDLMLGALEVRVQVRGCALWLLPPGGTMQAYVVTPGAPCRLRADAPDAVELGWTASGFPRLCAPGTRALLNGRELPLQGADLSVGDQLTLMGVSWRVAAAPGLAG